MHSNDSEASERAAKIRKRSLRRHQHNGANAMNKEMENRRQ
jgi:hypothetical protein